MKLFIPLVIVFVAACSEQPIALTLDSNVSAFANHGDEPDACKSDKSEKSARSDKSEKSGKSDESMKSGKSEECSPSEPPPPM